MSQYAEEYAEDKAAFATSSPPRPPRQVGEIAGSQESALGALHVEIGRLEEKLAPLVLPGPADVERDSMSAPEEILAPIAAQLRNATRQIFAATARIQRLTESVEL